MSRSKAPQWNWIRSTGLGYCLRRCFTVRGHNHSQLTWFTISSDRSRLSLSERFVFLAFCDCSYRTGQYDKKIVSQPHSSVTRRLCNYICQTSGFPLCISINGRPPQLQLGNNSQEQHAASYCVYSQWVNTKVRWRSQGTVNVEIRNNLQKQDNITYIIKQHQPPNLRHTKCVTWMKDDATVGVTDLAIKLHDAQSASCCSSSVDDVDVHHFL